MFKEWMNKIEIFLNTEIDDTHDFFMDLEESLYKDYDKMVQEEPIAFPILYEDVSDICAESEPGLPKNEIKSLKKRLEVEYLKAKEAMK